MYIQHEVEVIILTSGMHSLSEIQLVATMNMLAVKM